MHVIRNIIMLTGSFNHDQMFCQTVKTVKGNVKHVKDQGKTLSDY